MSCATYARHASTRSQRWALRERMVSPLKATAACRRGEVPLPVSACGACGAPPPAAGLGAVMASTMRSVCVVRADRLALVGRDGSYGVGRYVPSLLCGSLGESLGCAEEGRDRARSKTFIAKRSALRTRGPRHTTAVPSPVETRHYTAATRRHAGAPSDLVLPTRS